MFDFRPLLLLLLLVSTSFVCGTAVAQDYPTKPISLVVPQSPGTTPDIVARLMAKEMSKVLGQPIIVENKPGAEQMIALQHVAKQMPADGYTVALVYPPSLVTLPLTVKDVRFDVLKDLTPVIGLAEGNLLMVSPMQSSWKTFQELVEYSKARPGQLNYGSISAHVRLTTEALIRGLGLNVVHIPYSSGSQYVLAAMSGEIDIAVFTEAGAVSAKDKTRPVLVLTGASRLHSFPDVPTSAELGYPQIPSFSYLLSVRADTPKSVTDKLFAAASHVLQQPDVKASFTNLQMNVLSDNTPQAAEKRLAEEARFYADIGKKIGIQPQ